MWEHHSKSGHCSQRGEWFGVLFFSNLSLIYFVCLLVSHGTRNSDMINGGDSGIINDDSITIAEEKSSWKWTMRNHPRWENICFNSLQTYIKHSETALCIRFIQFIWRVVHFAFHCVTSLGLDNLLRVDGNLHVCSSFRINYSRHTHFWECFPG